MHKKFTLKLASAAALFAVSSAALAQTIGGISGTAGLGVDVVFPPIPRMTLPVSTTKLPGGPIQGLREHFSAAAPGK